MYFISLFIYFYSLFTAYTFKINVLIAHVSISCLSPILLYYFSILINHISEQMSEINLMASVSIITYRHYINIETLR